MHRSFESAVSESMIPSPVAAPYHPRVTRRVRHPLIVRAGRRPAAVVRSELPALVGRAGLGDSARNAVNLVRERETAERVRECI